MTTDTQRDDSVLLGEAEAIVQAEGKRLSCDEDTWDRELGELFAETPFPRPRAPQVGTTTPVRRRPRAAPPRPAAGCAGRPCPSSRVRATQRSPPDEHTGPSVESVGQQQR